MIQFEKKPAAFAIHKFNNKMNIPVSFVASYTTRPDKPTVLTKNVGGGGGKVGTLTITWTPLPINEHNGPGLKYRVYFKKADIGQQDKESMVSVPDSSSAFSWLFSSEYKAVYVDCIATLHKLPGDCPRIPTRLPRNVSCCCLIMRQPIRYVIN
jgi:hypothetical protein